MQYKRKPILTEATQWWKNGDHPKDNSKEVTLAQGGTGLSEGELVKYFRRLNIPGGRFCTECGQVMHKHGLLDGKNGEEVVHPGDYIVTDQRGTGYYVLRPEQFEAMYEPYEESHPPPQSGGES